MPGIETLSAGINRDADEVSTDELVAWSDLIFVRGRAHQSRVQTKRGAALGGRRVVALGIPDDYAFMDPVLAVLLSTKMQPWLPDA